MIVDQISLHAQAYVFGEEEIGAASEPIEGRPICLLAAGRQRFDDYLRNGISGLRSCDFMNRSNRRPNKEGYLPEVTVRKLWSGRKGLGRGIGGYRHGVSGRELPR